MSAQRLSGASRGLERARNLGRFGARAAWTATLLSVIAQLMLGSVAAQKHPEAVKSPRRPVAVGAPAPKTASLVVVTEPPGANLILYTIRRKRALAIQTATTDASGTSAFTLPPGRYRVVARHVEHREFVQEVTLTTGKPQTVTARLTPEFGFIVLTGAELAADAEFELDGKPASGIVRESALTLRIKTSPGDHAIEVRGKSSRPFTAKATVRPGVDEVVPVALEPLRTLLVVRSTVGARVYVDQRTAGQIPATGELRVPGLTPDEPHSVRLELDDYEPLTRVVNGAGGADVVVDEALALMPTSGPFEDLFLGGLTLWDAPSSWTVDAKAGLLEVRGAGVGLPKNILYRDCEVFIGLRLLDPRGAAWVVRAQDARNGYLFCLFGPGGRWPNTLCAYLLRDGSVDLEHPAGPPQPVEPALATGEFCRVRIVMERDTVQHWLTPSSTGQEVSLGFFRDAKNTFRSGAAGFTTIDGAPFQVVQFAIRPRTGRVAN